MARSRGEDDFEDDEVEERPRRRRRRRDEDDDDDAYDDDAPKKLGPLDKTFRDTNIVVLILFSLCCGLIAFILALIGLLTAKDPKAKSNATLVLIISLIVSTAGTVARFTVLKQ